MSARSDLPRTISPVVSLSKRWTNPGRGSGWLGKLGMFLEMVENAIDEGTRVIPMAGMHHQIHGLVDHQQIVVLVEDVQIHRLRQQLKFKHRLGSSTVTTSPGLTLWLLLTGAPLTRTYPDLAAV